MKLVYTLLICCFALSANARGLQPNKPLPPINLSDWTVFTMPVADDYVPPQQQGAETFSDEYRLEVSANQLSRGVDLYTTQSDTVILVTGHRNNAHKAQLDVNKLNLLDNKGQSQQMAQKVSQQALESAGILQNTVALRSSAVLKPGKHVLQSQQGFDQDDRFVITVKERMSKNYLALSTPSQSFVHGDRLAFSGELITNSGLKTQSNTKTQAFVLAPNGEKIALGNVKQQNNQFSIEWNGPKKVLPPNQGLYELHLQVDATTPDSKLIRHGKIAFGLSKPTAQLQKVYTSRDASSALVGLTVNSASRYEVRGVLYGTDQQGKQVPVQMVHAAQSLLPGQRKLRLTFDQNITQAMQVSAPFTLQHIQLLDQKQMALLDRR